MTYRLLLHIGYCMDGWYNAPTRGTVLDLNPCGVRMLKAPEHNLLTLSISFKHLGTKKTVQFTTIKAPHCITKHVQVMQSDISADQSRSLSCPLAVRYVQLEFSLLIAGAVAAISVPCKFPEAIIIHS